MTYEEIKDYIGKEAVVIDVDGHKIKGLITNTEPDIQTSSGKEEIEIDTGKVYYGVPLAEVREVLLIE